MTGLVGRLVRRAAPAPRRAPGPKEAVLVALGAYAATQEVKAALRPTFGAMKPQTKLGIALAAALAQAFGISRRPQDLARVALPATGLAVLFHRTGRLLQAISDRETEAFVASRETKSGRGPLRGLAG